MALIAGTVSVEADCGVGIVLVLIGECNARTYRYLSADYTIAAVETFCKHMHRSTLSVGNAFSSAKQLADDLFDGSAAHKGKAVTSVSGDDVVFFGYSVLNACRNGFLAGGKMAETSDLFLFV